MKKGHALINLVLNLYTQIKDFRRYYTPILQNKISIKGM